MKASFEHINVVVSIIIGLSITKLLEISSPLLDKKIWDHVHWIQVMWLFNLLIAQIQFWWSINRYKGKEFTFLSYVLLLLSPVIMFFMCMLVIPSEISKPEDMFSFFRNNFKLFYILATLVVGSNLLDSVINKIPGRSRKFAQIVLMVFLIIGVFTSEISYHGILSIITTAMILTITYIDS
ncbi:MAG TPA: hypothetical protein VFW07_29110 [Parafilimonas sp.]|nr:hypothetical protein [Parafilimonas sp.]